MWYTIYCTYYINIYLYTECELYIQLYMWYININTIYRNTIHIVYTIYI